jgi:hypothetical protein
MKFYEEIHLNQRGSYTEINPPKIPIWGVRLIFWLPNHLSGGVRWNYFCLRSQLGVLGRRESV